MLPVLGKVTFDVATMSVGKSVPVKVLGLDADLTVETSNDGSTLSFDMQGPAPLSALLAGRASFLQSSLGKVPLFKTTLLSLVCVRPHTKPPPRFTDPGENRAA